MVLCIFDIASAWCGAVKVAADRRVDCKASGLRGSSDAELGLLLRDGQEHMRVNWDDKSRAS